jgi:hypothetical protein
MCASDGSDSLSFLVTMQLFAIYNHTKVYVSIQTMVVQMKSSSLNDNK